MPVKWRTWRKGQILKRLQSIKTETGNNKQTNKPETGQLDFPGGTVDRNPHVIAGPICSIPGP